LTTAVNLSDTEIVIRKSFNYRIKFIVSFLCLSESSEFIGLELFLGKNHRSFHQNTLTKNQSGNSMHFRASILVLAHKSERFLRLKVLVLSS